MTEASSFDLLREKRLRYIESARENEFEEGLKGLLSELYPDNAHFIYELLQNAEDAGASEVCFDLKADGCSFEHDGTRHFGEDDIKAIGLYLASLKP